MSKNKLTPKVAKVSKPSKGKRSARAYEHFKEEAIRRMQIAMSTKYSEYQSWLEEDKKSNAKYKGVLVGPVSPKNHSTITL